jgi:hypothetical protein
MYFLNNDNQLVIQGEGIFDTNASYLVGIKQIRKVFNLIKQKISMPTNDSTYLTN